MLEDFLKIDSMVICYVIIAEFMPSSILRETLGYLIHVTRNTIMGLHFCNTLISLMIYPLSMGRVVALCLLPFDNEVSLWVELLVIVPENSIFASIPSRIE